MFTLFYDTQKQPLLHLVSRFNGLSGNALFTIENLKPVKMKKSSLIIATCLLFTLSAFAQREQTLFGSNGLHFSGIWGAPTTSITKFKEDYAVFTGGYGGLEFGRTLFIGWGGYKLINDVDFNQLDNNRFNMDYNGLIIGFTPLASSVVHPAIHILGGKGNVKITNPDQSIVRDNVFVVQPALGIELNVFRWLHIGLDAGYRFVMDTDSQVTGLNDSNLSAPYGELKFKFGISWSSGNCHSDHNDDN